MKMSVFMANLEKTKGLTKDGYFAGQSNVKIATEESNAVCLVG